MIGPDHIDNAFQRLHDFEQEHTTALPPAFESVDDAIAWQQEYGDPVAEKISQAIGPLLESVGVTPEGRRAFYDGG